jgi:dTDP-4-dehydrorhamnose reductase
MRVLVLGASGMLGNAMMRVLGEYPGLEVYGTLRSTGGRRLFPPEMAERLLAGVDVEHQDSLLAAFNQTRPEVVINCVGLVKQLADANDPLLAVPINTLLPHRLARLCALGGARLMHFSTDCVFSGKTGNYREGDDADATDLYGRSKHLGEVDYPHAITLRTSIIGHELQSAHGLINWFLAQGETCRGYTRAIFSGLPTVVLAGLVRDVGLARPELHGVYHVAAQPISKYDLLSLVASVYGKDIEIVADDRLVIDRSLDASRLREATGFVAPAWQTMIETMHAYR